MGSRAQAVLSLVLAATMTAQSASAACVPNTTSTTDLQAAIRAGGANYTLSLCQGQVYTLMDVLNLTAAGQEISTEGYPTGDTRATLVVAGTGISTAVNAQGGDLDGCRLSHFQVTGNRGIRDKIYPEKGAGANLEVGGGNQNQVVEFVRSYNPRGWSCLHIAEGPFQCANTTIQNNDIGPCGSDDFQQWADGISLSCADSLVQNNVITDPTDGGIVIFQSPGSIIRNNTIQVKQSTSLGGINMVDVNPWQPEGNYSHTLVEGNTILGGYATSMGNASLGQNNASAIIKIGIAIGPDVWWGDRRYGTNQSFGATVRNNQLSGGFAYGLAIGSARDFVIQNNTFYGNLSFVGHPSSNCGTKSPDIPTPPVPILLDNSNIANITLQIPNLASGAVVRSAQPYGLYNGTALGLVCFDHPNATENAWPYGGQGGINAGGAVSASNGSSTSSGASGRGSAATGSNTASGASASSTKKSAASLRSSVGAASTSVTAGLSLIGVLLGSAALL